MNAVFELGAEPVDEVAARLLMKSPWWAKVPISAESPAQRRERYFVGLGNLYERFCWMHREPSLKEFADLATAAHGEKSSGFIVGKELRKKLEEKLSCLRWNRETACFEAVEPISFSSFVEAIARVENL